MAQTFREILAQWPSTKDIAEDCCLTVAAIRCWRMYGRVPRSRWPALILSAEKWCIPGITLQTLREAHMMMKADPSAYRRRKGENG